MKLGAEMRGGPPGSAPDPHSILTHRPPPAGINAWELAGSRGGRRGGCRWGAEGGVVVERRRGLTLWLPDSLSPLWQLGGRWVSFGVHIGKGVGAELLPQGC